MSHTPGPWEIEEDDYGDELWFGGKGCGLLTVNGWSNGGCKKEPEEWKALKADARLIAAAPELLQLVRHIVSNHEPEALNLLFGSGWADHAKQVLEKVEGH